MTVPFAPALFFFRVQYPFDSIQAVFDIFVLISPKGGMESWHWCFST